MKGKRLLRFLSTSARPLHQHNLTGTFSDIQSIFPMLDELSKLAASYVLAPKNEIHNIIEKSTLKAMIVQTDEYLNSGNLTASEAAISVTMDVIKKLKLESDHNKETDALIAKAYYLEGEILSAGPLDGREKANKSYSKAINIAKQCGNTTVLTKAEKALRSWELNRYQVKAGESIVEDFDSGQEEKNSKRLD